jgi:subtilisin family serine protease
LIRLPSLGPSVFATALSQLQRDTFFTFVSQRFRAHHDNSVVIPVNRLLLEPKPGVGASFVDSLAKATGSTVLSQRDSAHGFFWYTLSAARGHTPLEVATALHGNESVALAEPDFVSDRRVTLAPDNPYYSLQYYLKNTVYLNGVRVDDNVEPACDLTTGSGITVAVLDHGIDGTHPQLCGGAHTVGYDLWPGYPNEDAWRPYQGQGDTIDMHGTTVAGIIASCLNNGVGTAGIAPSVTLISARIFRQGNPTSNANIAAAINWAWSTAGADVLSNSWGGGSPSDVITNAINAAAWQGRGGLGAAVVFSAGNTSDRDWGIIGGVTYPASLSSVLAVGAIDRYGYLTNCTPEGSKLGLVAPSGHYTGPCIGDVVTLAFYGNNPCNDGPNGDNNYTTRFSGTSAAAPQVAAAAALLLALNPTMDWGTAGGRIAVNSDYWGDPTKYGKGKLNIYHVLLPVAPPLAVTITGPTRVKPNYPCTWTAHATGGVAPYSYYWIPGGTQEDSSVTEAFSIGGYLTVNVYDAVNTPARNRVWINVSSSAPYCPQ